MPGKAAHHCRSTSLARTGLVSLHTLPAPNCTHFRVAAARDTAGTEGDASPSFARAIDIPSQKSVRFWKKPFRNLLEETTHLFAEDCGRKGGQDGVDTGVGGSDSAGCAAEGIPESARQECSEECRSGRQTTPKTARQATSC